MKIEDMSKDDLARELALALARETEAKEDSERVVHDLRVHQIELELQNRHLREAQNALEASRVRFEELYDFAPVAYFTLDDHGRVAEVNLTGATMVGQERARIIGMPLQALIKMDDPAALWQHLRLCGQNRESVATVLRFSTAEGQALRSVQAVSVPQLDPSGHPVAFRTAFTDITDRIVAEEALEQLRRHEERLRRGFEELDRASIMLNEAQLRPAPVGEILQIVVDRARSITDAEFAAVGIVDDADKPFSPWVFSGLDPDRAAAIGRHPRPVGLLAEVAVTGRTIRLRDLREHPAFRGFPPHHPEMRSFLGIPIVSRGRPVGHLYLTNKRSGDEFNDDDQRFAELLASRAAQRLEIARLNEELRAAVRARDNLLAVVSHDLRSPLSAISLTAQALASPPPGGERRKSRKSLELIKRSVAQLNRLIDDLVQASTIEAGAFTVMPREEEARSLVEEALNSVEHLAAEKSIRVNTEVSPALPAISCDRPRALQVLANLLGNAIKFVPKGGTIRIRVWAEASDACFSVSDTGPGIPREQASQVFDRYWKGSQEGRRGVGLGLFIAKGIVEAHRGRIWLETELGGGTTFFFTLPLSTAP